ncbi:hypothetical protein AGMMS50212_10430 [Spirochaetia bacterium]|nr:hypothetical protein AGMMS50212_10430 [Spirochaetia bacterium]
MFYKIKLIRNDVSHPNESNLQTNDFKRYIGYIIEFSRIIDAEKDYVNRLNKLITKNSPSIKNEESSNDKRAKILNLIETKLVEPALGCPNLDENIKESLVRTLIRFEISETLEDVNNFFKGALASSRGEQVYKELKNNNLLALEDLRADFNSIYYS